MKRVLMITASASYGGGPQHVYDLAKSLRNEVCVYIACPRQEPFYEKFQDVIDGELVEIPVRRFSLRNALRVLGFAKEAKISIIHSHGKGAGTYGRFVSLLSGLPLVHTPHGIHVNHYGALMRGAYLLYEKITGWINKINIFVSQSEYLHANELGICSEQRSTVIVNGVDIALEETTRDKVRTETRRKFFFEEDDFVVVSLSRFDYAKNMLEMILIAQKVPSAKFLLLGDGPDYKRAQVSASKLTTKNVYLPGFVDNPLDYLMAADLYLSTSRWEGMPLAILQAMAVALPVIATRVVGNYDAVQDGKSGYLYEAGKVDDAATCIQNLQADVRKRKELGVFGKRRQKKKFSLDKMAGETLVVYKMVGGW